MDLSLVQSSLFGRFLVSLPYINTGGVWADSQEVAASLIDEAVELADQFDVKHLELRHESKIEHCRLTQERTDKVHMRLSLPGNSDDLLSSFKSKLRSQVKKSGEANWEVHWGGRDLIKPFYDVFAENMRDLGTPVYSPKLFQSILDCFGGQAELCVLFLNQYPAAGALLVHYAGITEVPSASALRRYNPQGANMWMYWQLLQRAIERNSAVFDFGRSSVASGTYRFKEQWGATPFPACWQYYVRHGSPAEMRPDSAGKQNLVQIWKRLPVWLTRIIGPPIVRGIP